VALGGRDRLRHDVVRDSGMGEGQSPGVVGNNLSHVQRRSASDAGLAGLA
jgi:hypothetical protein